VASVGLNTGLIQLLCYILLFLYMNIALDGDTRLKFDLMYYYKAIFFYRHVNSFINPFDKT